MGFEVICTRDAVILAGGLASDFTLGELDAYIFPRALALPRPIATAAKPYCHSPLDYNAP